MERNLFGLVPHPKMYVLGFCGGRTFHFWLDKWVPGHRELEKYSLNALTHIEKSINVNEFVSIGGQWDKGRLEKIFHHMF